MNFAHAVWVASVVVVFVDGGLCGRIQLAFDLNTSKSVRFEDFESRLSQDIAEQYQVTEAELAPYDGSVFEWATDPFDGRRHRSTEEFRRRIRSRGF